MELPKDRRPQALASMCADDVGLRRRVERYLELEARSRHFLAKPAFSLRGTSRPDSSERLVGGRVGPWRLTGCLGRGGMGIVFSASRDDGHFEQEAALKLLSDAKVSAENLARFHAERQILAGLEHPGIARLVDGGTTDEGLPYLVMERVIGQSIDEAIQGLARRERLELFLAICEAVEVAHQNLIVHRDLKPSNILVTAVGQPKLLDFGIAKWLRDEGELTQPGAGPMTPKWASPEQLQGGRITTATDVYALGLLLYFMLVGDLPEPDRSIDSSSGRRARDRKAIGPQAGGLGEELAILVAKALERDPADRYTSARQLADDVKRYLT
ncbi:MAG: serine/threonine-protein kinase, partial [Acidobacteriota bacterium]